MQRLRSGCASCLARLRHDVANARVHATTGEVPADRLVIERAKLQALPKPYLGRTARNLVIDPKPRKLIGYQHPLSTYDALLREHVA